MLITVVRFAFFPTPWLEHTMRVSCVTSAYACSRCRSLPYSRLMLRLSSLCRTGSLAKTSRTDTVVPTALATTLLDWTPPSASYVTLVPASEPSVRVVTESSLSAHSDESASPRNPNEFSVARSVKSQILEVAYFLVSISRSPSRTPHPLSTTSTHSFPWSRKRTSMFVAPASSAFSTSSFTAPARSSTTCPEQMRCMEAFAMGFMLGASLGRTGAPSCVSVCADWPLS